MRRAIASDAMIASYQVLRYATLRYATPRSAGYCAQYMARRVTG